MHRHDFVKREIFRTVLSDQAIILLDTRPIDKGTWKSGVQTLAQHWTTLSREKSSREQPQQNHSNRKQRRRAQHQSGKGNCGEDPADQPTNATEITAIGESAQHTQVASFSTPPRTRDSDAGNRVGAWPR